MQLPIDFFARWPHFVDHLLPIYQHLGERAGSFFVAPNVADYLRVRGVSPVILKPRTRGNNLEVAPEGNNPLVVAATGDMQMAYSRNASRPLILMEHGPGITFPNNSSYAGSQGLRRIAKLTLAPNFETYEKTKIALPNAKQVIVGTPYLDPWCNLFDERRTTEPEKPTVCIAFHWDGSRVQPEAGNAYKHYQAILPVLAQQKTIRLIAHGHPRNINDLAPVYQRLGIEIVWNFEEVLNRADLLINDCSSIAYMFLVTGKPVILLNAPWFRRNINYGLRFWDYTDIGQNVNNPKDLIDAIQHALKNPNEFYPERKRAVENLFPFLGYSATMAARAIRKNI